MNAGASAALRELAGRYGVQTSYLDVDRRRRTASPASLLAALRALGADIETLRDIPGALRQARLAEWRRTLEPALVAWDGRSPPAVLRLPAATATGTAACRIDTEAGDRRDWTARLAALPKVASAEVEGESFVALSLPVPQRLPPGRHRLTVETPGWCHEAVVLSAPRRAHAQIEGRRWGVILPLYAARSGGNWGSGDFGDLGRMAEWAGGLGGSTVATLPLLPAFLGSGAEPLDPSPYAPVSRRFWNEMFIDIAVVPELACCEDARATVASAGFQDALNDLRSAPLVDYQRLMSLKQQVLSTLARQFFAGAATAVRMEALRAYVESAPAVEDYACFRAACGKSGFPWQSWPEAAKGGRLSPGDYDEDAKRYHMYVQWIAHEQVRCVSKRARTAGVNFYFDLPLGVHPGGYDAWRERSDFAEGVTTGAPPDTFFARGQDWGFAPPHPERVRASGHRYFTDTLRHHLAVAGVLRIDHVMGLHRLYWVPDGMDPVDGVYVRYPADEMYAVLAIESHRHRAAIVGEDLGTVPTRVRAAMARHGIQRSYVLQYEVSPGRTPAVARAPRAAVATLNTHDMPPFAAFWNGLDIDDGVALGIYGEERAAELRDGLEGIKAALLAHLRRECLLDGDGDDVADVLRACLRLLAGNAARLLLVNLEDMWLETSPQNVPGTGAERPNWRRKATHSLEAIREMPEVTGTLGEIDRRRRAGVALP